MINEQRALEILKEIGLGKSEIDVYLDLLKSRASTATDISKRIHQHRSNVYDALKRLQNKSLVVEIVEEGRKLFEAQNPETLLSYWRQRESEIRDLLPTLTNFSVKKRENEFVSVSYGTTRIRTIIDELMGLKKEVILWGLPGNVDEILGGGFVKGKWEEMGKKKIPTKLLYSEFFPNISKVEKKVCQQIRYTEVREKTNAGVIICEDNVIMLLFTQPLMIIEMKGKEIAHWYKAQFFHSWRKAREPMTSGKRAVKRTTTFISNFKRHLGILKIVQR